MTNEKYSDAKELSEIESVFSVTGEGKCLEG